MHDSNDKWASHLIRGQMTQPAIQMLCMSVFLGALVFITHGTAPVCQAHFDSMDDSFQVQKTERDQHQCNRKLQSQPSSSWDQNAEPQDDHARQDNRNSMTDSPKGADERRVPNGAF